MINVITKKHWFLRIFPSAFLIISLYFIPVSFLRAQPDGAKLFKANCSSCHRVDEKKLTGPGLKGVFERVPNQEWLYSWIKNSSKVIASGDAYATKIFEDNGKVTMTPQEHLSKEQIDAILGYIKNPPVSLAKPPDPIPNPSSHEKTKDDNSTFYFLIIISALLFVTILVLSSVKNSLQNVVNAKKGLPPAPEFGFRESIGLWFQNHKVHTVLIILLLVLYGSTKGWYALKGIGVYQGYSPAQPIKFSHKIHAGQNQINCVYCHHSAEKGKTAGIPSINVCMNCHKGISSGATTGTSEINKIYEAAGFNPETQKYDKPQKPVKWIRVHNLPDFAYFNHSQHVVVGKQQCQTCHGKVEEMDVVEQKSPLTMGWCVDCHRTTKVASSGNGYYEEIHARMKSKNDGKDFTVAENGGLECGKCHY